MLSQEIIEASRYGRYVVFKYDMGAYDDIAKEYHSINNSGIMNNNSIISRLRDKFKTSIENHLGGWTAR